MSLNKIRNKIFLLCDERHSIVKLNFEIIRIRTIPEYSISLLPFSFDANFFCFGIREKPGLAESSVGRMENSRIKQYQVGHLIWVNKSIPRIFL